MVKQPGTVSQVKTGEGLPYYIPTGREVEVFQAAYSRKAPVMLKGPTGCGKTRFVQHMAVRLGVPVVTVPCHDDLTAADLVGRHLIQGGETKWVDGPLTRAVREGAICYLDEVIEARKDTVVVIHPLTDDRRTLFIERTGETLHAPPSFMLVMSFNPGYQSPLKALKPSTRQRFVGIDLTWPEPELEEKIVCHETGIDPQSSHRLVRLARKIRPLREQGLEEIPGTRAIIHAANLIKAGVAPVEAAIAALGVPLTEEPQLIDSIRTLAGMSFPEQES
ncbi:MAG: CbbQ/NirQ/NorQ/GpvN family protein [Deltaproteobacteria bacterium]|nr:CbbQ/NirQ/NorQ/GpvN family protein [Deltaproteobacteria bacterium]